VAGNFLNVIFVDVLMGSRLMTRLVGFVASVRGSLDCSREMSGWCR